MAIYKIALTGKAGVGKDTLAAYAVAVYGFRKFAFADRLKELDYELFGPTEGKNRKRLQMFGQFCRQIDPDVWVNQLDKRVKGYTGNAIITDVRQWNELQYCQDNGFVIVKVICDDVIRFQRMKERGDIFNPEDLKHETETQLDEFPYDYWVDNNGTFNALTMQFDCIIRDLSVKQSVK